MAIDRAEEGRKKAKASREAGLEKSRKKAKKAGKWLKGVGKRIGIGQTKEETQAARAEHKAKKAKKKEGEAWTKAVKKQKKTGGASMNELIKQRNAAEKGSEAYAKAQNQINKAYGSKKRYEGGGKVEANPYGWPSRDARNGGKG